MRIEDDGNLRICDGERVAGVYVIDDSHKCFIHELATPAGHVLGATSPSDHLHHKGLMYALRASDVNWWEERESPHNGTIGRQRHDSFDSIVSDGDEVGFTQRLEWVGGPGGGVDMRETRCVSCRRSDDSFVWNWRSELTACRDLLFTQSPWSHEANGLRTNYQGLGVRLRRDLSGAGSRNLFLDQKRCERVLAGMRAQPEHVMLEGDIDPIYPRWPPPRVSVSIRQLHAHRNALFCMDSVFPYLALGPSNLGEFKLANGERLIEQYEITVADVG